MHMRKDSRRRRSCCMEGDIFLQPWFLDSKHAAAIRSMVPEDFVHKMRFYFEDWGCLVCRSRKRRYGSNGMCHICVCRVRKRLADCLKRRHVNLEATPGGPTGLMDEVARVRSAKTLLMDIVNGEWSPSPSRLSSSVRRTR